MNSYNWILANQELTISQLRQLNTKSKIIALSRKETESPRTTKRDRRYLLGFIYRFAIYKLTHPLVHSEIETMPFHF